MTDPTLSSISQAPESPQADSAEWRQAHWAFIVIGALRNMRGWIVPLAIVAVTQGVSGSRADYVWYGLASLATIGAVGSSLVEWWMYRYRVTERDTVPYTHLRAHETDS